ncbi:MAG: NUDIX hydrolase [Gammaproteobacteria bacterium]|nr:NUDIX hydrolase [Gammaproteobacteria bacterium]
MTTDIWKPNTVVAAIVEVEHRFLFVEELNDGRAVFNQPAGHLDPDETLLQAVQRETLEEAGCEIAPLGLVGIYLMEPPGSTTTYVRYCFHAALVKHYPDRALDTEILRALWMTRDELAEQSARHRSPLVLRCVDDYLTGKRHPLSLINDLRF